MRKSRFLLLTALLATAACHDAPTSPAIAAPSDPVPQTVVSPGVVDTMGMISVGGSHRCGLLPNGAAYCWGENLHGQLGDGTTTRRDSVTPVVGGLRFKQISAGGLHTCALTPEGAAYCWGINLGGRLGDGTTTNSPVPVAVTGGRTFVSISAGGTFTCGITDEAALFCWGRGDKGQLGIDSLVDGRSVPREVAGGRSWRQVSAGFETTCATTTTDEAFCWGNNPQGQVGDGTITRRLAPTPVAGGHAWKMVSSGRVHSCGVDTSGRGWCWGTGTSGQLGTAGTGSSLVPVAVYGTHTFAYVSAGQARTCAATPAGKGFCWGTTSTGPQSLGSPTVWSLDVGDSDIWCAVRTDTGRWHCVVLDASGRVPLPRVASVQVTPPSEGMVPGEVAPFTAIPRDAAGNELEGRAVTWSSSDTTVVTVSATGEATAVAPGTAQVIATSEGVSGSAAVTVTSDPVATVTITPDSIHLLPGESAQASVVLRNAQGDTVVRPVTWTSLDPGVAQVNGTGVVTGVVQGTARIVADAEGVQDTAVVIVSFATLSGGSMALGQRFTCGLTPAGKAYCWGRNGYGQLGNGSIARCYPGAPEACSTVPVPVSGNLTFKQLTADWMHACGITTAGQAYCWGLNDSGQLGNGSTALCETSASPCSNVPVPVAGGLTFKDLAAGHAHTCGVTTAGETWCWGSAAYDVLGGSGPTTGVPRRLTSAPAAASIDGNGVDVCILTAAGKAYCWGGFSAPTPTLTAGSFTWAELAAGDHKCGIRASDGLAFCWGYNSMGGVGDGTTQKRDAPVPVSGGLRFVSMDVAGGHSCGVTFQGQVYCWGAGGSGQLGTGGTGSRLVPALASVVPGVRFATVFASAPNSCGVSTTGVARCWGDNSFGQIGDGTTTQRPAPTRVSGGLTFDTD